MDLSVQYREKTGKGFNKRLRKQGIIPGILYGKGKPVSVSMETKSIYNFIRAAGETKKLFRIDLEYQDKTDQKQVIIQDYQMNNLGDKILHVDFFEVDDDTVIHLNVPIKIINEDICPAVKAGAVLQIIRRTIPVRCMAKDISENILVDVQNLEFGENIHVLDLEYDEGITPVVTGRDFTILTSAGRMAEEEEIVEEEELIEDTEEKSESEES